MDLLHFRREGKRVRVRARAREGGEMGPLGCFLWGADGARQAMHVGLGVGCHHGMVDKRLHLGRGSLLKEAQTGGGGGVFPATGFWNNNHGELPQQAVSVYIIPSLTGCWTIQWRVSMLAEKVLIGPLPLLLFAAAAAAAGAPTCCCYSQVLTLQT